MSDEQQNQEQGLSRAYGRMPQDQDSRRTLAGRLRTLGQGSDAEQDDARETGEAVVCRLGEVEQYAFAYRFLDEILPPLTVTPVPCTPAYVAGVVNRRGELLTVLDLKQFFKVSPPGYAPDARILALRVDNTVLGVRVDEVLGQQTLDFGELHPAIASEGVTRLDYVQGIYAGRVTVIDVAAIVRDTALLVDEKIE